MPRRLSPTMVDALRAVAPGTDLREGLDRILLAGKGALIVVGAGPSVLAICSGGFLLDTAFTPQRLSELAKMDGAIILAADAGRIARANVHLVPDPSVHTSETGTRHRTAERVARSLEVAVVSVSEDMRVIQVYFGDERHRLEPVREVLLRANGALQTLERYRARLDDVETRLSSLEIQDLATLDDVVVLLQRFEMVTRIADEIRLDLVLLGDQGRQVDLQLRELMLDVEDERRLVVRDHFQADEGWTVDDSLDALTALADDELLDPLAVSAALHRPESRTELDEPTSARGHRMLSRIPRLPAAVADQVVAHFGSLPRLLGASLGDLVEVEGVGEQRALAIIDGLNRSVEQSWNDVRT